MSKLRDPLWISRVLATVYALFFAAILVLETLFPPDVEIAEGQEWEGVTVGVLGTAAVAAAIAAWRHQEWTFRLMLGLAIAGALLGLITAGSNQWLAVLTAGGPYAVAAALAWFGRRN
ncbi:MAG: hypothetical protein R3C39_14970 [Dehalococcoidia bacterium]